MRPRRHALALWFGVVACAATTAGAAAASPSPAVDDTSSNAAVSTLAGPGYCPEGARRDPFSASVRALAVDQAGDVFFDTGTPAAGSVARVAADGSVSLLATGVPSGRPTLTPTAAGPGFVPFRGRLAADESGGVLVAAGARVLRVDATNSLTTVAGDPAAPGLSDGSGASGDGGPAVRARFARASSLASDARGSAFVADVSGGDRPRFVIRFINRTAHSVTFFTNTPDSVTVDPGGIGTIAGTAVSADSHEPGDVPSPARSAYLPGSAPVLAVAGDRLYIAIAAPDRRGTRVLVVDLGSGPITAQGLTLAPGQITAVAGTGSTATEADAFPLSTITGMATEADGRLYLAEETRNRVLQADPAGRLSVVAGHAGGRQSDGGFDGDGHLAAGTRVNRPFDVKVGGGRVYIADQGNDEVRAVDRDGIIRAVAGGGIAARWACSEAHANRPFGVPGAPTSVVIDAAGVVYVALPPLNRVQRLDLAGVLTTVAGGGGRDPRCRGDPSCAGFSGDAGLAVDARLDRPTALALGSADELYILDGGNSRVRLVNLGDHPIQALGVTVGPGDIATVAGSGVPGSAGDGGLALRARILEAPAFESRADSIISQIIDPRAYALGSLAAGSSGDLFIVSGPGQRVRRVDSRGVITSVTVVTDGSSRGGCCAFPVAVAEDGGGDLFIADRGTDGTGALHPHVWLMNRSGRAVTALGVVVPRGATRPVAGDGAFGYDGDGGPALEASLEVPIALAAAHGSIFITEAGVSASGGVRLSDVRAVDTSGTITTVAGGGAVAFNGDGLPGAQTNLNLPSGAAADRCGNLLIADTGNDRVRRALLAGACAPIGAAAAPAAGPPGSLLVAVVGIALAAVAGVAVRAGHRRKAAGPRRWPSIPRR